MSKKVSVIIPTYKRSEYLPRAITSVINTGWDNLEIIIVADEAATLHVSDGEPLVGVTMRMPKERA